MLEPEDMIRLVEFIAVATGEKLVLAVGVRRFGKHSWRSTGAVFLSGLGIDIHKLMLLARWASAIIMHYARVAPLKSITDDFKRLYENQPQETLQIDILETKLKKVISKAVKDRADKVRPDLKEHERKLKQFMDNVAVEYATLQTELRGKIKAIEDTCAPRRFWVNRKTKLNHNILIFFDEAGAECMTDCG